MREYTHLEQLILEYIEAIARSGLDVPQEVHNLADRILREIGCACA